MLQYFKVDKFRDTLYPSVEFYQMGLSPIVDHALKFTDDTDLLPSWSKFNEAPVKAQGFWTYMLQAVFEGKHNTPELHSRYQFTDYTNNTRVAMMFLGKIRNEMLEMAANIAQDALRGWMIVPVYGTTTNNRKAEKHVKTMIEQAKMKNLNVLIIAANMAQRSFSVPQITELYLAYDQGAEGATIQKMSRTLTPDSSNPNKIGRVISLSFDPNRDDKFDSMIVQTAYNYNKKYEKKDIYEAMKDVLKTIDIFFCQADGRDHVHVDDYLNQLLARKTGIDRVIGKTIDMSKLSDEDIIAIADGSIQYARATKTEIAERGKTKQAQPKPKSDRNLTEDKKWEKIVAEAREAVVAISENVDVLVHGTGASSINEALNYINNNPGFKDDIANEFGVGYDTVDFLFRSGALNEDLLQLKWRTY